MTEQAIGDLVMSARLWARILSGSFPDTATEEARETLLSLATALETQAVENVRLAGERDDLRLAICGGEDAPGHNASLPHEAILGVLRDNYQSASRDAVLAWDGETATAWKARAFAAEHRLADIEAGVMREKVARLIDPSAWRVMDGYLAEMLRKYAGKNAGYDPDSFKHEPSLALADKIFALISRPAPTEEKG